MFSPNLQITPNQISFLQRLDSANYFAIDMERTFGTHAHVIKAQEEAAIESAATRAQLFTLIDDVAFYRAGEVNPNAWEADDWALNSPAFKGE